MTKPKVQAIEYDRQGDIIETKDDFDYVEDAIAWCEARRGAKLHAGDTEFGYQLMTEAERDAFALPPFDFPERWYEVHGVEDNGEIRYLEEDDHRSGKFQ